MKTAIRRALADHPARFSLAQALRLLALDLESQGVPRGEIERHIRIVPWLSLAFPSSEVVALAREYPVEDEEQGEAREEPPGKAPEIPAEYYRLENTQVGLYGTLGPLPTLYTEELLDEARADRDVVRSFLDLVNNRVAHLFCRAEGYYDYARRLVEQGDADMRFMLYSLMGQAYPELRPAHPPRPLALELLAQARTADGLANYLESELPWPEVRVEECVLRDAPIPREQRCRLGKANTRVGENLVVGESLADVTGKIRIHLRNLPEERLQDYLDGAPGNAGLRAHVSRYMDEALEFDLVLHPAPAPPQGHTLGAKLRVGCHLSPPGKPPTIPVLVRGRAMTHH
ncbi:MAG: type VI secretion system baseplate subunit TssG [Candidatus Accumulibacter sp.]|jgi:type VI secretion system protein ImpH|nr:type VI secretion system baseplate subunit TssG [Accumulibacter sp.]